MSDATEELRTLLSERVSSDAPTSPNVRKFLELLSKSTEDWTAPQRFKERVESLRILHQRFIERHEFNVGDIIQWKKSLKNRKHPAYNEPVVVVELLAEPIHDATDESGSPYFRERLDIVLGIVDPEGDFLLFHYDQRRFEPAQLPAKG